MEETQILIEQAPEASILRLQRLQLQFFVRGGVIIVSSDGGIPVAEMLAVFHGGPGDIGDLEHRLGHLYGVVDSHDLIDIWELDV